MTRSTMSLKFRLIKSKWINLSLLEACLLKFSKESKIRGIIVKGKEKRRNTGLLFFIRDEKYKKITIMPPKKIIIKENPIHLGKLILIKNPRKSEIVVKIKAKNNKWDDSNIAANKVHTIHKLNSMIIKSCFHNSYYATTYLEDESDGRYVFLKIQIKLIFIY